MVSQEEVGIVESFSNQERTSSYWGVVDIGYRVITVQWCVTVGLRSCLLHQTLLLGELTQQELQS